MDTFCSRSWNNYYVDLEFLSYKMCCRTKLTPMVLGEDWFNSKSLQDRREGHLTGTQHKSCNYCWAIEANGLKSFRKEIDKPRPTTVETIKDFLEDDPDDNVIEALVNELREVLLEMEQQGFVDVDYTDKLDDQFENDWIGWIKAVIELPDFPEEGLNNVMAIINNPEPLAFDEEEEEDEIPDFEDDEDDVECPDCDGTGQDEDGEECERCEGEGRVYRPDDIPPD